MRFLPLLLTGTLPLLGCSSGASSSNGTFNVPPTTTDGSESDTTGSTSDDPTFATDGSTDASTTDAPDLSTTGSSGGDLPDSAAFLEWSVADSALDYGAIPVDDDTSSIVLLENTGGHAATSIATGLIPGPFSFPGGYPGTEGDCGTELGPGESCRLDLRFGPNRVGPVESALVLDYYDGVNLDAPTQTNPLVLRGGGSGESANLLVNGDAETGEVAPWTVPAAMANWQTTDVAYGGMWAFTPTGALTVTALEQTVSLTNWNDDVAVSGLRYRVRARARSNGEHTYRVFINFGDDYESLAEAENTSWTLVEEADLLPLDAEQVVVRIECANGLFSAGPCDVQFDDVTLQLVYP